jgi:hypothetical protein
MIGFRFLLNRAFGVCARLVFTGRLGHNPLLQMAVFFTFCLAAGLALLVGTAKAGTPRRGVRSHAPTDVSAKRPYLQMAAVSKYGPLQR